MKAEKEDIDQLFEIKNFYNGDNFNTFKKIGKQKGVIDYFKKIRNKVSKEKNSLEDNKINLDNQIQGGLDLFDSDVLLLLLFSISLDILASDHHYKIIFLILFELLVILINFLIAKNHQPTKIKNNFYNLKFEIKNDSTNSTIYTEEINLGDQIVINPGIVPLCCIIIEGSANVYELNAAGEYSIERKTIENPFINKNCYIIDGKGLMIACSLAEKVPLNYMEKFKNLKFQIKSSLNSTIYLRENYETSDYNLKLFCDYLNDSKDWELISNDNLCKIERKFLANTEIPLMRTSATLNFSSSEIFNAIVNVEVRKKWDVNFQTLEIIESDNQNGYDSPVMMIQQRDLVQRRKIIMNFANGQNILIQFKSIEHISQPINKLYVRANTIISGYYINQIQESPPKSNIYVVSQTDLGGSIPQYLINAVTTKAPRDWILNLIKGCEMVKNTV